MHPKKVALVRVIIGLPEPKPPKHTPVAHGGPVVSFQLRDNQQVQLSVEALDSEGNAADASASWSSSDEVVASVDSSGLVTASPGAAGLGATTITATVTDNSDGDTHEGTFEVEVVGSDAVTVNVTAGAPEDKPVAGNEPPVDTGAGVGADAGAVDTGAGEVAGEPGTEPIS